MYGVHNNEYSIYLFETIQFFIITVLTGTSSTSDASGFGLSVMTTIDLQMTANTEETRNDKMIIHPQANLGKRGLIVRNDLCGCHFVCTSTHLIISDDVIDDKAHLPRSNLLTLDLKAPRL